MAIENFAPGTLIIPMDETYQNTGMWLAYGLVNRLLRNGIPVKWAILPGKPYNGTDFTASAQDLQTMAAVVSHGYKGGPFIIDSSQAAAALPIITAWQSANPTTKVHRATVPFSAPIASTMSRIPRIAVEETNSGIMTGYLNAAKIYDSQGNPWPNSSPDILEPDDIGNGAFFGYNETDPCKQLAYDIFLSPHTSDGTWTNPTNAAELDTFVKIGGMIHATCHSISAIENFAGPFLTAGGITSFPNKGDTGSFIVDVPDFPSAQAVPTSNAAQALPGGSEQTWLHTSVTYLPSTQVLAHFTNNNLQYDFMVAGSYKGGTGAGKVVYEGGHQYSTNLPYSNNFEGPYLRFIYDSIFFSISKPRIVLTTTPRNIPAGSPTLVTFTLVNDGGSPATGLTASVTLGPFTTYTPGSATVPPTSIVGQTLTWNAAALAAHQGPGTVLSFTATVTPPGPGIQSAASYTANFGDSFNESFTMPTYCASINATPGAAPVISKTPSNQSANPNGTITWTLTAGNNGTLALNNVVITDTLPAGLTFASAVPAPSSVVPGPGNTTIITWQAPQIAASIPPLTPTGITITLNATAPGATSAAYTNQVTLTGTDTSPSQYTVNASAGVTVNDRPPTVTLTAPLSGTICPSGTTITWTGSDPDGDPVTYTVIYSSDSGTTFPPANTIITDTPATSVFWPTASLPSGTHYRIKIIASDGLLTAESSSPTDLTIDNTPPTANWVTPTNGSLLSTTPVQLAVSATDALSGVASVQFSYSTDGLTFNNIGSSIAPPYTTNWETNGLNSGSYILRAIVTDNCGNTAQLDINVTVDLPPVVTLTYPNGGEIICPPGATITWTASDPNPNASLTFTLYYSANGGSTYTQIATGLTGNNFIWSTAGLPSGNNYRIKIVASDGTLTAEDTSNASFTVDNTPPVVTWVTPANGALITTNPITLEASATDNIGINNVQFQYSTNGITYTNIGLPVTVPSSGTIYSTSWDFSSLSGGLYHLRAVAADNPCGQTSHADITANATVPPTVTVTSPQPGDIICPHGTTITWTAASPLGRPLTFTIQYSATGGAPFTTIATGLPGPCPCSYSWDTTGLTSGSNYVIKIIAYDGLVTAEALSGIFTIDNTPPAINWISPPNGALITSSPLTLQASATDNIGITSVRFQYSSDGVTYNDIAILPPPPAGNTFSYSWNFSSLSSGVYHLRAIATDTPCNQTSQAEITATLSIPPTVTLVSPNGGEIICPDQGTNITWNAFAPNGDTLTYSLLYSDDGGNSYTIIATGLTGVCTPAPCSYHWDTSALPSGTNYLIKVIASNGFTTAEDVSNATFSIDNTSPVVAITTPLPDSYLHNTVPLQATATDNISIVGGVTFEYSFDNGVTYNLIGTVPAPLGGIYALSWNTTARPNGKYKIRAGASDHCTTSYSVVNVVVDNTPPTVQIPSPPNNSTVSGEVPLLVKAEDNECLAKVELYIDGQLVHTETLANVKTSEFLFDWNTNDYSEGPHSVKAVATDCAGLVSETTNTYIVDNLPDCYQQVLVDGTLTIPPQKPDIEGDEVLDMTVTPTVRHINIFNTIDGTKVTITGTVEIGITYAAVDPYHTQEEHFAHFNVPFHAMILCPDLPLDAKVKPVIFVEHKQWHVLNPRTIKKDIVLFVGVKECK